MKNILSGLVVALLIIFVHCLEHTETNIKRGTTSTIGTYDKCETLKNGTYSCRCGKKKVIYNRFQQKCIKGKVTKM